MREKKNSIAIEFSNFAPNHTSPVNQAVPQSLPSFSFVLANGHSDREIPRVG